jgi:hypothetical protein
MPASPGPTSAALGIVALVAVAPFFAIAVVNVVFAWWGWTPLTQLVENYLRRYPLFAAALAGLCGALVGHVFWSFGDNLPRGPAPFYLLGAALGLAVVAGVVGAVMLAAVGLALRALASRFFNQRARAAAQPRRPDSL